MDLATFKALPWDKYAERWAGLLRSTTFRATADANPDMTRAELGEASLERGAIAGELAAVLDTLVEGVDRETALAAYIAIRDLATKVGEWKVRWGDHDAQQKHAIMRSAAELQQKLVAAFKKPREAQVTPAES